MSELGTPHDLRAQLAHHALKGKARTYFHQFIQDEARKLAEVFHLLSEKFLDPSTKMAIRTKLTSVTLDSIQKDHGCTKIEAVERVSKIIDKLTHSAQQQYQNDESMIDVMEKHVLRTEKWSADVANRRTTHGLPSNRTVRHSSHGSELLSRRAKPGMEICQKPPRAKLARTLRS